MSEPSQPTLDVSAYFERIGYSGDTIPGIETLRRLHLAHATNIPFENIDPLLGRPVPMDLASIQAKLITARRGGYCFEQNTLFAAVLEYLGFSVLRLSARVHVGTDRILPRTHKLLKVESGGKSWICDVGFGSWGLLEPIELQADQDAHQGDWILRLVRRGEAYLLQCPQCPLGPDLYSFTLEPQLTVDFEPVNHYCSTYPKSRFVLTLTAQMAGLKERVLLRNHECIVSRAHGTTNRFVSTEAELREILSERFHIVLPDDTPSLLERIDRNVETPASPKR